MRTIFVTGSSRGIGLGIAKAFAANGDRVFLNAKQDEARLQQAMRELNAEGCLADMADEACAREAFGLAGEVDVLVNNAGSDYFGLLTDMTAQDIDRVLRDNLQAAICATQRVVPAMVKKKQGVIVNITSVWGVAGASCEAVYAAAKAGIIAFTKSMAKELGPSGIRVNAIACGAFDTRMNDRLTRDEKAAFAQEIPLRRFGKPEEAGALAVFLASPQAGYLTGQVIALDGGLV